MITREDGRSELALGKVARAVGHAPCGAGGMEEHGYMDLDREEADKCKGLKSVPLKVSCACLAQLGRLVLSWR